jgi:hypothetical protein
MTILKALPCDFIDGLLANYQKPEDLIGENGLFKQLAKALVKCALEAKGALRPTVNPCVAGSSPARGAKYLKPCRDVGLFLFQHWLAPG